MTVLAFETDAFLHAQVLVGYPKEPEFLKDAEPLGRHIGRLSRRLALLYIALTRAADMCHDPARQYSMKARQIARKLEFRLEEAVRKKFDLKPNSCFSIGPGFEVFVPSETKNTEALKPIICDDGAS